MNHQNLARLKTDLLALVLSSIRASHETDVFYPAAMAKHVKRAKSFSFDLLADWAPHATPPGPAEVCRGWVLHGTATLNGVTGALAFCGGWYGIKVGGQDVADLGMWERIDVSQGIEFKTATGWEHVPKFETSRGENYDWKELYPRGVLPDA